VDFEQEAKMIRATAQNAVGIHVALLDAGNDRDGQPRRLYRITIADKYGIIIRHVLEGYHGNEILKAALGDRFARVWHSGIPKLGITQESFRELAREANALTTAFLMEFRNAS
jgi:hypothetical protein